MCHYREILSWSHIVQAIKQTVLSIFSRLAAGMLLVALASPAQAVPAFARQTKLDCMACHVSWPELTPTGRRFKLNGYTLGERQSIPLAGMLQFSRTTSNKITPEELDNFPKDGNIVVQQASVFAAGKISEHWGAFTQFSYDGVEHRTSIDNVDLRYANHFDFGARSMIYGFTLHNNPMVQDIYNTGPTWGFPFASSSVAIAPAAATAIEGLGQQVAGLGAYALWSNTLYGEFSLYRTANHGFSILRAGTDRSADAALKGQNPYLRLALQREWAGGAQSAMIGTYGLKVDRYPDNTNPTGPTDRFKDIGVDAQYQYITDLHRFSLQFNFIRETQNWTATTQSNATDVLKEIRGKVGYYYNKKYGLNIGYFSLKGSADDVLYNSGAAVTGSENGSPNSSGYILELNYLPKRDIRLTLQYTGYKKFNGAKNNYDGFGRNAKDNNTLYLLAWFMF
jgi:hypothetical protein